MLTMPPEAPRVNPAVAPITRKDVARARMFGLKLPADAPQAVEPKGVGSADPLPAPTAEAIVEGEIPPVNAPAPSLVVVHQGRAHRVVVEVLPGRGRVFTVENHRSSGEWLAGLSLDDQAEAVAAAERADLDPDLNPAVDLLLNPAEQDRARSFAPTWEELDQAAALFGRASVYHAEGWPGPPPVAPVARKPARAERPTGIRDEDVYAAGGYS